jgi:uncharacterized protein YceH (UPF0502 family)
VVRDSRVPKYEHRIRTVLNLRRDETAVLCLLFLRGPQTPGELRARADRLYSFDGLEGVESTLGRLTAAPTGAESSETDFRPLVTVLPRQPGSREARYAHLLSGPVETTARDSGGERLRAREQVSERAPDAAIAARVSELEAEVTVLRAAVARIEAALSLPAAEDSGDSQAG